MSRAIIWGYYPFGLPMYITIVITLLIICTYIYIYMNVKYHIIMYVLYVLHVSINIVCMIVRMIVRVICKIFKFIKTIKVLTTYLEIDNWNLSSHFWFGVYGSTEYAYAVGAWALANKRLLRHYIKRTLIFELSMIMEPTTSRVPNHNHDWENPHMRVVNKSETLLK